MKKWIFIFYFLISIFYCVPVYSQTTIFKTFDPTNAPHWSIQNTNAKPTADGGMIIAGSRINFHVSQWLYSGFLIKLDSAFNIQWSKKYDHGPDYLFNLMDTTSDGGYMIFGGSRLGCKSLIVKTNSTGKVLWGKYYIGSGFSGFRTFDRTKTWNNIHDGYIMAGNGVALTRLDNYGNLNWYRTFHSADTIALLMDVKQTPDRGFITTGWTQKGYSYKANTFLLKTDSAGNFEWANTYDSAQYNFGMDLILTDDNSIVVAGKDSGFISLLKTDIDGTVQWFKSYSISQNEPYHVINSKDKGFLITYGNNSVKIGIFKVDSIGNFQWAKEMALFDYHAGSADVWEMEDSTYRFVSVTGPVWLTYNLLVAKTNGQPDSCSTFITSCTVKNIVPVVKSVFFITDTVPQIMDTITPVKSNFLLAEDITCTSFAATTSLNNVEPANDLLNIFPNPTTDFITIHYNVTSNNKTTVMLYNLYGQPLTTPLTPKGGLSRSGEEIKIDIRSFAAGVYFVKMRVDGKEEVRKVVKYE